jgi:hypothetical protein
VRTANLIKGSSTDGAVNISTSEVLSLAWLLTMELMLALTLVKSTTLTVSRCTSRARVVAYSVVCCFEEEALVAVSEIACKGTSAIMLAAIT